MTVSNAAYLKTFHNAANAAGKKIISSDFALEVEGFEANWFLMPQCPWPVLSPGGEIEVSGPLGTIEYLPQQIKTAKQGPVTLMETVAASIETMLLNIITKGGTFNAKIYEGTPEKYLRYKRISECFIVLDDPDRNWEDRSQVLKFTGTLFYHYFGEIEPGNSADYR